MEHFDLLRPTHLFDNYRHQLRQTISAYSPTMTVLGEALQNAIDAIVETDDGSSHLIEVELDFDERSVKVTDTGVGFSNNPNLLFLGGGTKRSGEAPVVRIRWGWTKSRSIFFNGIPLTGKPR